MSTDRGRPSVPSLEAAAGDAMAQLVSINAERGVAVLAIILDGILPLIVSARAGDREARRTLRHLYRLSREIAQIAAVTLPGEEGD